MRIVSRGAKELGFDVIDSSSPNKIGILIAFEGLNISSLTFCEFDLNRRWLFDFLVTYFVDG